jgi:hypothetical protein
VRETGPAGRTRSKDCQLLDEKQSFHRMLVQSDEPVAGSGSTHAVHQGSELDGEAAKESLPAVVQSSGHGVGKAGHPDTPDNRYFVVRGRLWRCSNPALPAAERQRLTQQLMRARSRVGAALRAGDKAAERAARGQVDEAKVALGERGPVWWTDGAPDSNRHMAKNTPYAAWFAALPPSQQLR